MNSETKNGTLNSSIAAMLVLALLIAIPASFWLGGDYERHLERERIAEKEAATWKRNVHFRLIEAEHSIDREQRGRNLRLDELTDWVKSELAKKVDKPALQLPPLPASGGPK